jgi:hypothetical protein
MSEESKGPWWANLVLVLVSLIKQIGVGGATLLMMCSLFGIATWYFITYTAPILHDMSLFIVEEQQNNKARWDYLREINEQASRDNKLERQREDRESEAMFQIEQQICINMAKSSYQTDKCLEIRNEEETLRVLPDPPAHIPLDDPPPKDHKRPSPLSKSLKSSDKIVRLN